MTGFDTVKVVMGSKRNGQTFPCGTKPCSSRVQRYKATWDNFVNGVTPQSTLLLAKLTSQLQVCLFC